MKKLGQYLKNIQKESTIEHFLPSTGGELGVLTSDFDIKHIVCFAFNVVSHSTAYTDVLEDFLATEKKNTKSTKEWFDNAAISAEMRSKSSTFIDFVHKLRQKRFQICSHRHQKIVLLFSGVGYY